MLKALSLLPLAVFATNWQQGACPKFKSDVDDLALQDMTGLWFEYVWTEGFQ